MLKCPMCGAQVVGKMRVDVKLGEKIKIYRAIHSLTQEDLAVKLRIPRVTINRWEKGRNYPSRLGQAVLEKEGII